MTIKHRLACGLAAISFVTLSACSGGDDGGDVDAGLSASCQEAVNHDDLPWIQENVFDRSCGFSGCHGSANPADALELTAGMSMAGLAGVDSIRDPNFKRVLAGNADDSYLLMIMGRNPSNPGVTINRTMPVSNSLLCDEKVEAVARWVNSL